ncbi:ABC transporter ATP-binding protein/permease [Burkholderia vietnamiensis]|uniref:ABC transporter ATP-binding protein/permease n=1 Tax=Burkholderia vietnamiensis TaxID=60552 RepID=UPI001B8FA957|nr:ATP-binding cassette domain-containing protein [Burkholderia vietnamiensis]MBR7972042.1 ABC transporter ATP-binding protein/permease [Burkholderia vietnamiensis]
MTGNRAFPIDRAEDTEARRHFPSVWRLLFPYWRTREGVFSLMLLMLVVASSWAVTYVMLWNNTWTGTFYDAIGASRFKLLPELLVRFLLVAMAGAVVQISGVVLQQIVQIRWRRWLTAWLAEKWLARHNYYRIERDRELENVDQRIAEDVKLFVNDTLLLGLGFLSVPVSVVSFSIVLWRMAGPLQVNVGGSTYALHGYLVFAAFAYTGVIFAATHFLGRRLITLTARQHRVEGDFRVLMVGVREFAEQIAFFQGQTAEHGRLQASFRFVVSNLYATLWVNTRLMFFTNIVGQVSSVIPTLLVLPQLLAGGLTLGGLMKSNGAFHAVTGALAFFPQAYPGFTSWRAEANRLREFLHVSEHEPRQQIELSEGSAGRVAARGLVLRDASGETLSRVPDFVLEAGQRCLVRGRSGCGKSTLLRALAGLWPYGEGTIARPADGTFFLPQRSYIPPGSLKAAMTYPRDASAYADSECEELLHACGLSAYAGLLHVEDRWSARLSGGEQQRVAFARVLLAKPSTVFLDECTSALDSQSEKELYGLLIGRLPQATVVSVAHRKELLAFHDTTLDFPAPSLPEARQGAADDAQGTHAGSRAYVGTQLC